MTDTAEVAASSTGTDDPLAGHRIVARTILRPDQEIDIRPLYVSGFAGSQVAEGSPAASRRSGEDEEGTKDHAASPNYISAPPEEKDDVVVDVASGLSEFGSISESSAAVVNAEKRMTFGTYFNAFPASYWRRWTDFESVRLVMRVRGHGSVIVYRSTAKGHIQRAESTLVSTDETTTIAFDLPLKPFIDGGWYWFDLEAADQPLVLEEAVWAVETDRTRVGRVSIGITTYNRPDFCVDQLIQLSQQPDVLHILDQIYVIDQGSQKVKDHEKFDEAAAALGRKLRVIEQGNLGGSGGFSRAMDETTVKGDADYVLLLDDDVVCEPQGILRAVTFADLAKRPILVGGHMFSLYDRSVMHAYGEKVARWRWFWGPAPGTEPGHNWARKPLRTTKWLHKRVDVDYNGWWMCLIPTKVIREIGLSLPMFIKWDDADFGLRAVAAGYPTATLPGTAVWHVPWHEKDDTIDWQAYYHRRNRIIAALLHSPYERGGKLVRESLETQVRHLLSMQYAPAELALMAIEDILEGPQRMHRDLLRRLPEVNALRKQYTDSQPQPNLDDFPEARRTKPPRRGKTPQPAKNMLGFAKQVAIGMVRQNLPVRGLSKEHPETNVAHLDLRWWLLAQYDSALVSSADGTSASWYKRDPDTFRDLAKRSVALHARLAREWPTLAQQYRDAVPDLASPKTWAETFEESIKPPPSTS